MWVVPRIFHGEHSLTLCMADWSLAMDRLLLAVRPLVGPATLHRMRAVNNSTAEISEPTFEVERRPYSTGIHR
jgi:hypothetical protein